MASDSSFRVAVTRVERPFSSRPMDELDWICESLGIIGHERGRKMASVVFKEILRATEEGKRVSARELVERLGASRGSVVNHLNNLMRCGLVVRSGRHYSVRSPSIYRTLEEIEADVARVFEKMKKAATGIDRELGIK